LGQALAAYRTIPGAALLRVVDRAGQLRAASEAANCGARLRNATSRRIARGGRRAPRR
jgi:hypothetical protein